MSRSDRPFLTLIVPSYKQEQTIVENVHQLLGAFNETRYSYEILVILDGKVDNSFEKLQAAKLFNTTVYMYPKNRGKSFAIRFGMKKARGKHVMFLDAGMEIDPDGISMLLEHLKWYNADIIVGSKRHLASQVQYTWQRKLLSISYYYLVKFLFGVRVKDTQAGIKVFRRQVVASILPKLVEQRFAGDLEMLVVAKMLGHNRIFEAPIKLNYHLASLSNAATWKEIYRILRDTLAIFYRLKITSYYQTVKETTRLPRNVRRHKTPRF